MNLYNEYFSGATRLEKVIEQSVIGANLKELKKDQFLEQMEQEQQYLIGQDLKGQRDFLGRQLVQVAGDYRQVMESRNDAYLKVQNMNTLLINECNKLREEKSKLKEYLGVQKKAYREVKRQLAVHLNIDFNQLKDEDKFLDLIEDDEEELEGEQINNDNNFIGQQQDLLGFKGMSIVQATEEEEAEQQEFQDQLKESLQEGKSIGDQILYTNENNISPAKKQQNLMIDNNQSLNVKMVSQPSLQPLKSYQKNRVLKKQSELPFVAYQNKLEKKRAQTSQPKLKPLSITEKKQNERQLISDLLRQIEDINSNEDSINSETKMKDRVQSFLLNERKDTVGPLISKESAAPIKTASTNYRSRKQISQQSRNPISPPASASKASTQTGFMQTVSSNLGGFSSTGADFFRRPIQSSQSTQK